MSRSSHVVTTTRWRGPRPRLPALDMELTERCQNNCLHCSINLPADDPVACRELSTAELQRILQEAADLGCLQVRFTGGEPLLRDDFATLYLHARRLGMRVLLFTNARRITPSLADLFARVRPLERIEVSVYGMTAATYDAVARSPGAYAEFRRGVDLLLARRIPFVVKWAVLPPNRDELDAFLSWAATLPWADRAPGISAFFQLRDRRDDPAKNRLIARLRWSPEETVAFQRMDREQALRFCRRFLGPPGDRLFPCGICEKPCVDAYGRLQPCLGLRAPEWSYDLREGSLREAVERVFPPLRQRRATHPEYLRRCARCFLRGLCEQCPAKSWAEHGTLDTPVEYLCAITHEQARLLGLLREREHAWEIANWRERIAI